MTNWNQKSREVAEEAFKAENLGGTISGLAGGITGIVDAGMKNAQIADTSGIHSSIDDIANTEFAYNDYDSLLAGYNPNALQSSNYSQKGVRGVTGGEMAMNTISGAFSGAAAGAQVGGPWGAVVGGVIGLGSGLAGIFTGNDRARREANLLNAEAENANRQYMQNFALNASNIGQGMFNSAALNLAAEGGQLDTYDQSKVNAKNFKMKHKKSRYKGFGNYYAYGGQMMSGDWSNGVVTINEGDTHERNPLGGVLMGIDQQGIPNLVEEGEVIFNDYVYSNRLKPTAKQLEEMHLDPKLEGLTYSEAAKKIQEESEIRPLDNISKNTLVDGLSKLTVIQEETRMKKERAKMLRALRHMAIQEQQGPQEMQEEVPAEGGLPMENQGAQMPEAQFAEHTPRAYKQIQEEMPEQYAYGGLKGNIFSGPGDSSNVIKTFPEYDDPADDNPEMPLLGSYPKTNFLQYAPAIGSAITTLASLFQKPDYSNADRVAASRRNVRRISSRPISGYLGYNPYDTNLQQTKLANQTAGAMRNVLNTSSGNRAAAMTDLLAYNAKGTEQSGDIYRQALEFNDAQRLKVGAHNAEINKFNSQQGLQADSANQSTDLRLLDNVLQEARMRDAEYAGLQSARSANLSNLFNNMGEIGKDIYASAQEKFLIDRGYVPGVGNVTAKGGSIRRRKRRKC